MAEGKAVSVLAWSAVKQNLRMFAAVTGEIFDSNIIPAPLRLIVT